MVEVKNLAKGPRTVEERVGENGVRTRVIAPGETADVDLVNPQDPVLQGLVENRDLEVGGGMRTRRSVEVDHEKISGEIAEGQKQLAELKRKQVELETQLNAPRFANDPKFKADRAAAMAAGHAPGYSDGPLPGAEPGPETEETLKKLYVDPKAAAEADPARGGVDAPRQPGLAAPVRPPSAQPEPQKGPTKK